MRKLLVVALLSLFVIGCGGGDKKDKKAEAGPNDAPAGVELTTVSLNLPGMT